jgi:hypothetical protein
MPSVEYAMVFVPSPVATHRFNSALYATPKPSVLKIDLPSPNQDIPSYEYEILFVVPYPTLTYFAGDVVFAATPYPKLLKVERPSPVHVMPSVEYAMEFVPSPTATHRLNSELYATSNP